MSRGRRKTSRLWAYGTGLLYLFSGAVMVRFFEGAQSPDAFASIASAFYLYIAGLTASNILLSFGSGFLSPDEAIALSPLPVSSETFFASRLLVLLTYTSTIAMLIAVVPFVSLIFVYDGNPQVAIAFLLGSVLSNIAAALAIVVLYGFVLRRLSARALAKVMGYVQFVSSFAIAICFVIIPRLAARLDPASLTIARHAWLAFLPATWFGSLSAFIAGTPTPANLTFSAVAIVFVLLLTWSAIRLLGKHYQTEVAALADSSLGMAKAITRRRDGLIFRVYIRFARSSEARAVFMLIRAQFRYDTKFRLALLALLPLTVVYFGLALLQGGIKDPFTSDYRAIIGAQFLYFVAMLMPVGLMQTVSQSENYKAAWIFFASPADRSKLLLAVRNTLLITVAIPYMTALAIVFSYYMPWPHAIEHVLVLSAIGTLVFQGFLLLTAKMPFAQPRRPNQRGVAQIAGGMFLVIVPYALLALEIVFGYRSTVRFWSTFALLVTLSLLMEQAVRSRVRVKLDREEFES